MTIPGTPSWHGQFTRLYVMGLGIEDIAVRMGSTRAAVELELKRREETGQLAEMERRRLERWRKKWGNA